MSRKVISYSLFGGNPLYELGAIENTKLAKIHFPGWYIYIYYHPPTTNQSVVEFLNSLGATTIPINHKYNARELYSKGTFWRYYPLSCPHVNYVIFRDCDSRLSHREASLVSQWVSSHRDYHLIFDHETHVDAIVMGGLWGSKGGLIGNIKGHIANFFIKNDKWYRYNRRYDQYFLHHVIYKKYIANTTYLAHSSIQNIIFNGLYKLNTLKITPDPQNYIGKPEMTPYAKPKIYNLDDISMNIPTPKKKNKKKLNLKLKSKSNFKN